MKGVDGFGNKKDWDQAVKQLKNLTRDRMNFKVKTAKDANKLLSEA